MTYLDVTSTRPGGDHPGHHPRVRGAPLVGAHPLQPDRQPAAQGAARPAEHGGRQRALPPRVLSRSTQHHRDAGAHQRVGSEQDRDRARIRWLRSAPAATVPDGFRPQEIAREAILRVTATRPRRDRSAAISTRESRMAPSASWATAGRAAGPRSPSSKSGWSLAVASERDSRALLRSPAARRRAGRASPQEPHAAAHVALEPAQRREPARPETSSSRRGSAAICRSSARCGICSAEGKAPRLLGAPRTPATSARSSGVSRSSANRSRPEVPRTVKPARSSSQRGSALSDGSGGRAWSAAASERAQMSEE